MRPTMLIAQLSTAVSVAVLGFMVHPVAIAGVAFVVGMASNASRPAVQAMMADIVRPEDRVRAFSLNYWAVNLGFAVSSAGAGFIAEYSYLAGFMGEAALTLVCAVVVFLKVPESRPEQAPRVAGVRPPDDVRLSTVLRDGRYMGVVGLSFLVALIFQQGYVGLPVAMGADGLSASDFGTAIAVNGVLIVVLQIPVTRFIQHRDPRRLLIISSLLAGYGFGLTAFAGSVGVYALTVCVWTLAEIVNAPTQTGIVVQLSPSHGRGRYQGMYTMSWSVAALVAPLMSGFVIDHYGAAWLWGTCAVLGTVTAMRLLAADAEARTAGCGEGRAGGSRRTRGARDPGVTGRTGRRGRARGGACRPGRRCGARGHRLVPLRARDGGAPQRTGVLCGAPPSRCRAGVSRRTGRERRTGSRTRSPSRSRRPPAR